MTSRGIPMAGNAVVLLLVVLTLLPDVVLAENIDPAGDGSQYAWAENVGWISAEQDTDGDGNPDQGVLVEDFKVTGWMWGENVGWISLSCITTESCNRNFYGVRNNGGGGLSGQAWSENVGWINFSCADTESCGNVEYGVAVDPSTGEFFGHAWGENIGWISFDFEDEGIRAYRIKSEWNCDPPPGPPEEPPVLFLKKAGERVRLSWSAPPGATGYDVVLGGLATLRISGDFRAATWQCIGNRYPVNVLFDETEIGPGEGLWFLVRGANCGGHGSYDSGEPSQEGLRDDEIELSGNACY